MSERVEMVVKYDSTKPIEGWIILKGKFGNIEHIPYTTIDVKSQIDEPQYEGGTRP